MTIKKMGGRMRGVKKNVKASLIYFPGEKEGRVMLFSHDDLKL
jgi:hypothetical protein